MVLTTLYFDLKRFGESKEEKRIRLLGTNVERCPAGHQTIKLLPVIPDADGWYQISNLVIISNAPFGDFREPIDEETPAYYGQCETCGCIYAPPCELWSLAGSDSRKFPIPLSWPFSDFVPPVGATMKCSQLYTSNSLLNEYVEYRIAKVSLEIEKSVITQIDKLFAGRAIQVQKNVDWHEPYTIHYRANDGEKIIYITLNHYDFYNELRITWRIFHKDVNDQYEARNAERAKHGPKYMHYGSKTYYFFLNMRRKLKRQVRSIFH